MFKLDRRAFLLKYNGGLKFSRDKRGQFYVGK